MNLVKFPPKLEDAIKIINDFMEHAKQSHDADFRTYDEEIAAWEKIKYDLRRLQAIDERHDLSW